MKVYPAEQWMVIGAEHAGAAILGVLVQSVDFRCTDRAGAIPDQDIVQYQAGQGMEGMPPGRN